MTTREPRSSRRLRLRLGAVVLVLLAGAAVVLSVDLPTVAGVRSWLDEGGPARWPAAVLVVSLALQTPVSQSAISVLLGAVVGFPAGLAVALGGGLLGGLAGFALSRWLGREAVARLAGARLAALDRRVGGGGSPPSLPRASRPWRRSWSSATRLASAASGWCPTCSEPR